MRSLTVKLTLAFLLVGAIGAVLVAVIVGLSTRREFTQFLSEHDQAVLVQSLSSYYTAHDGWEGVAEMLKSTPPLDMYSRNAVLIDASGTVLLGNGRYPEGANVPPAERNGTAITAAGHTVGMVLFATSPNGAQPNRPPPDASFLSRVTQAAAISVAVAALLALLLGALLARTLTRPMRELTAATQAMARGKLDQRVSVRSRDEVGELAQSFNQMSADLARASQLRNQMTADLAHDLRTPLSILRGYTEGLQDGRLQGAQSVYTIMHGEVEHLQRLVEDLRVLSLADAGELPLNLRPIDPAALLERTALAYFVQAEQQGVALQVQADDSLPSVVVDTDRMAQVLNNLVSNALRYTDKGGRITLRARKQKSESRKKQEESSILHPSSFILLTVSDSGSGIAAEDLPFIFDRFYRADKARQRRDSGTSGLGLAITKAIVEAHGGTIAAESTPGVGTTFTIMLPAAPVSGAGDGGGLHVERAAVAAHKV
jgi:two-component system sensor histidine kinase BaeS